MTEQEQANYILVRKVVEELHELDNMQAEYYVDPDTNLIVPFINCNDLFWWGCADGEDITEENFHLIRKTSEDIEKLDNKTFKLLRWIDELFCCRSRGMRPQIPYYKDMPDILKPLFDACGPERTAKECG